MVQCRACGTENPTGTRFCSGCARSLDIETQRQVEETRRSHTATGIRWSSVILSLIIFLIIVAVVALVIVHGGI